MDNRIEQAWARLQRQSMLSPTLHAFLDIYPHTYEGVLAMAGAMAQAVEDAKAAHKKTLESYAHPHVILVTEERYKQIQERGTQIPSPCTET